MPRENAINNESRDYQDGKHMYTHGWFMRLYGKNHHSTVKWVASD